MLCNNDTPVLIGYNSDEGASFWPPKTPGDYIAGVKTRYGKFADDLIKAYPVGTNAVPKTARDLMRDAAFGWHTWSWARLQSQTGKSKAFYYYFDQHAANQPGSWHGMDVAYVFHHLNRRSPKTDLEISDAACHLLGELRQARRPQRRRRSRVAGLQRQRSAGDVFRPRTPHIGPVPSAEPLKVLDAYFAWRRTPEGEAWAKKNRPCSSNPVIRKRI